MNRNIISDYFKDLHIDEFKGNKKGIFLLTHFHKDHIKGLTDRWKKGQIYCSKETSKLLCFHFKKVCLSRVNPLDYFVPYKIMRGVTLTLYPSNHLAGGAMFYFQSKNSSILYTGDYKYINTMILPSQVDILFIDNTYQFTDLNFNSFYQSYSLLLNWLKQHKDQTVYIGYVHLGTCELLKQLHNNFGISFQLNLSEKHQEMVKIGYPDIWTEESKIILTQVHRRADPLPKPIIIPSARWHLKFPKKVNTITRESSGKYRLNFTNHSTKDENIKVIKKVNPTDIIFIN
jgi:Cft2 family RNA processing exonuclease